ncbi:hypothetical protein SKAU_G00153900 [Synaphobranchus kaupii]|uniref:Uncharacterized protein n=1 Tax=Synaphobranchus kaupii TaxID=118154 RepID=A0A9Q1FHQ6_SYNKA|nr:hypothetical protein SKAU_G00153900 [Synaphobranchus kaupii]
MLRGLFMFLRYTMTVQDPSVHRVTSTYSLFNVRGRLLSFNLSNANRSRHENIGIFGRKRGEKKRVQTLWSGYVGPVQGVDDARVIFPKGQVLDEVSHVDLPERRSGSVSLPTPFGATARRGKKENVCM